jgi:hypothetical protein
VGGAANVCLLEIDPPLVEIEDLACVVIATLDPVGKVVEPEALDAGRPRTRQVDVEPKVEGRAHSREAREVGLLRQRCRLVRDVVVRGAEAQLAVESPAPLLRLGHPAHLGRLCGGFFVVFEAAEDLFHLVLGAARDPG